MKTFTDDTPIAMLTVGQLKQILSIDRTLGNPVSVRTPENEVLTVEGVTRLTGYSAAIALSRKILSEGQPAVDAYLDFLSKGDSEYSIDLLKGAGVDMSKKDAVENAMAVFESLLDEMEKF